MGGRGFALVGAFVALAVLGAGALLSLGGCAHEAVRPAAAPASVVPTVPAHEATADADIPAPERDLSYQPPVQTRPVYPTHAVPARPPMKGRLEVPLGREWRYIVVHHSFTTSGSAASFDREHKERGWLGVGYHFVIGNGDGSPDGLVEATFRWEKQLQGAHAGVEEYNQHGIGVCLVGDFETGYPTEKQLCSLAALTNYLQARCDIPASGILLHRHVKQTACPGRNFPFYEYVSLLAH